MKKIFFLICLFSGTMANAQMWGLYTLYSVKGTNHAYLIDTNSVVYKTWTFPINSRTGFSSYLVPGDTLVRAVNYPSNIITGSSATGEVQKVDWNNNIVWDYVYSDSTEVIHHDIRPMPNGNVLMLAFDIKSAADMTQAGSSSATTRHMDKIIEVHPTGPTTGTIVWEWKDWDHLCQNYDNTKDNYVSSIVMNPQLLNINHSNSGDFTHMNGIDYNPALDQIAISSYTFSEIFVIDHSTTTAQAAGHTGGNSGHGGDIIYRWGDPAAYGATGTQIFHVVHDAHWVPADNPYYPNYLCGFNNDGGLGGLSAIDIFSPPYSGYNYSLTLGSAYAPSTYSWLYTADTTSTNEGNSQQFPNGNSLVCLTFDDSIIEVNQSGATLWRFNPGGKVSKSYRYSKCYVRGSCCRCRRFCFKCCKWYARRFILFRRFGHRNQSCLHLFMVIRSPGFYFRISKSRHYSHLHGNVYCHHHQYCYRLLRHGFGHRQCGYCWHQRLCSFKQYDFVYPNPTTGIVNISCHLAPADNFEISCRNVYGQTIMNAYNSKTLDFSGFANGVYYMTIKSDNSTVNYKLVKTQ